MLEWGDMRIFFLSLLIFLPPSQAQADEAVDDTVKLLKSLDQNPRKDAKTAEAQGRVDNLVGNDPKLKKEVYDLSGELFQSLAVESKGDPGEMQKKLTEAQRSPEAYLNSLSPDAREKIRKLASEIEPKKP